MISQLARTSAEPTTGALPGCAHRAWGPSIHTADMASMFAARKAR